MAITRIEYYNGNQLIGTKTSAPFNDFLWRNAPTGNHRLSAKLYIDGVLADTSPTVNITVNAATGGAPSPGTGGSVFGHETEVVYIPKLLNPDYTGNWAQLTAASDETTTIEVPFDASGNPDTAVIPTGEYRISKYYDQSGNGRDWVQNNFLMMPEVQRQGVRNINDIPAIQSVSYYTQMSAPLSGVGAATSVVVASQGSGKAANTTIVSGGDISEYSGLIVDGLTDPAFSNNAGNPTLRINGSGYAGTTPDNLHTAVCDGTPKVLVTNGLDLSTWTALATKRDSTAYHQLDLIGGHIIFKGNLTTSQIQAVEAEVTSLFGI